MILTLTLKSGESEITRERIVDDYESINGISEMAEDMRDSFELPEPQNIKVEPDILDNDNE